MLPAQALPQATNKLYFYCGILDQIDGRTIQNPRPDKYGYYCGYPLSVFGEQSLNKCYYDTESYYNAITSPKSAFNIKLTHGNLYGEWGHPDPESSLLRMGIIDRTLQSHHFRSVYIDKSDSIPIIRGDVKPVPPCGHCVEASLLNPFENTAFSLRCLMTEKMDPVRNAPIRTIVELITFDCVDMPGYTKASKRYAMPSQATECLVPITLDMLYDKQGKRVALESFSDIDILDIFGITNFDLNGRDLGSYVKGSGTYIDTAGTRRSVTHTFLDTLS